MAVGIGSNLGERARWLARGVRELAEALTDLRCSRVYETEPVGRDGQPRFLNLCCVGRSGLAPGALLERLQAIEGRSGRERKGARWGPRTLDLDLLLYGDRVIGEAALRVPHPRMLERAFVMVPLAEVAAGWRHPERERTIGELAGRVPDRETIRLWGGDLPAALAECRERDGGAAGRKRARRDG